MILDRLLRRRRVRRASCADHDRTEADPPAGSSFTATAYCTGKVTATGTAPTEKPRGGTDPAVLPLGARIRLTGLDKRV